LDPPVRFDPLGQWQEAVQCVANRLPGLETLSIEGLRTVTDETFAAYVAKGWSDGS
jgi:hypothetical protein